MLDFLAGGLTHASGWQIFLYTMAVTHITIASVTIFLHRHQAHRALDLHLLPSHFFRFWLWLTTGQVTKEWAAIHRKHHAKCETDEDPHSPQCKGIKTVFWTGAELYRAESENKETIAKYGQGTPDDWIERHIYTRHSAVGIFLMLTVDVALFGAAGLTVWAVQMAWIPVTAAGIINGLGHYWGYRNYDCADASTNLIPWGILIGGEELHNNHHTFGTSAKLSSKWYEFDIGWLYIRILQAARLAKVKKIAPQPKFDRQKAIADIATLHAVVTNRYHVAASYARSIRRAWREECVMNRLAALDSRYLRVARKLIKAEPSKLELPEKQQLSRLFEHSTVLKTMHEMRVELAAIWERSHATSEQLLAQLQDWCTRAESSQIEALRDFSLRLRSYA
jgi:stearoyl-CoA desaturase (delta-9 desaturase)